MHAGNWCTPTGTKWTTWMQHSLIRNALGELGRFQLGEAGDHLKMLPISVGVGGGLGEGWGALALRFK